MNNFLVLENDKGARQILCDVLHKVFNSDINIAEAQSLQEGLSYLRDINLQFDLALIDVELPDGNGIDFLKQAKRIMSQCQCIIVTMWEDKYLFDGIRAGMDGYLIKERTQENMVKTLSRILTGEPPLSPLIARQILRHCKATAEEPAGHHMQPEEAPVQLTKREEEILTCIGKGYTDPETAKALSIARETVASHIKNIYSKLNISSRGEAGVEAKRRDLV